MHYEMMFPHQIRRAIDEHWPVVLAAGVLEYHGEHSVVGVDTILIAKALEALQADMNLVILPAWYYGTASYAVEPPERNGSVNIGSSAVHAFARDLFRSLLRIGFRNIHVFVHHQSENFSSGMPTDLAFRFAGRQEIFEFLERDQGEGWWGRPEMAGYFQHLGQRPDPFAWIQVHPFRDPHIEASFGGDHAGKHETSLMLACCPEGIDLEKWSDQQWYAQSARDASADYGRAYMLKILEGLRRILAPPHA